MDRPAISETTPTWDVGIARVPLRVVRRTAGPPGPPVLFLHGFHSAPPGAGDRDVSSLAAAGFTAVVVEAPHHGRRRSPRVDEIVEAQGPPAHELFLRIVREAVAELPAVVERARAEFGGPLGVVGVSMGAYTALAAATAEPRLSVVVSILGSPDWAPREGEPTPTSREWLAEAPICRPERFPPRALLLANAGRDANVPPAASRAFAATLRPLYADHPDRLDYREYPESEHFMREADWNDLWSRTLEWLRRFLVR
ncbi:MAG: alpha/beta fold hydrolase [Deltaproteobacteria bacterium]|nr:alpha/beta fold hydrolase [Deltaproteobacteria bacterium]